MREPQFPHRQQSAAPQPAQIMLQINWKEEMAKTISIRHLHGEMTISAHDNCSKPGHKQSCDERLALKIETQKGFVSGPGRRAV
jgi:hypothetical protein